MARRAINVETLSPALQHFLVDRKWHVIARILAHFASIEICVLVQLPTGHRALNRWTCRAQVSIKVTLCKRLESRLVVHVLSATSECKNSQQAESRKFAEARHLAWHLRDGNRIQAFQKLPGAERVVIFV